MRSAIAVALALVAVACKGEAPKPVPVIDRAKFEPLYRAGKTIESASAVGLNLPKLNELIQGFATEVSIAKDKASAEKERVMVAKYEQALQAYQDCATLWQQKIVFSNWEGVPFRAPGRESTSELVPIVSRHKLNTATITKNGVQAEVITEDGVSLILVSASKTLAEANKAYYAEEVPGR